MQYITIIAYNFKNISLSLLKYDLILWEGQILPGRNINYLHNIYSLFKNI